jgi:hypothetical protein
MGCWASRDGWPAIRTIGISNSCGQIRPLLSPVPRDWKELLYTVSEVNQWGRRPYPGKHGSVIGKPHSVNCKRAIKRPAPDIETGIG